MTNREVLDDARRYVEALARSGLTIYDPIEVGDPTLWIPAPELQALLEDGLRGLSVEGLALKTRSKVLKQKICEVLGYPVPKSFRKTRPRFPGQMFDTHGQKRRNVQVYNEEVSATRRYVFVEVSKEFVVTRVKVITGEALAFLDNTRTLTSKYQARCVPGDAPAELISAFDSGRLSQFVTSNVDLRQVATPVSQPKAEELLPIAEVFNRLSPLVGRRLAYAGIDQERNRGAALHRSVCAALGYSSYQDDGQFPDIRHQLLEVKLQTSPTIDLGLVRPNSAEPLDVPMIDGVQIRHCDVRYAVFYARVSDGQVVLTHLLLSTGEAFFGRFQQFQGIVVNRKQQIPLPSDFFDS